jgi:hypothetical protein
VGLQQLRYIQFPKLWRFYSLTLPFQVEEWMFWSPNLPLKNFSRSRPNAFVNMSASCSCERTWEVEMIPACNFSLTMWQSISICLVRSWNTWLAVMCKAASLSQFNIMGFSWMTLNHPKCSATMLSPGTRLPWCDILLLPLILQHLIVS